MRSLTPLVFAVADHPHLLAGAVVLSQAATQSHQSLRRNQQQRSLQQETPEASPTVSDAEISSLKDQVQLELTRLQADPQLSEDEKSFLEGCFMNFPIGGDGDRAWLLTIT